MQFKHFLFASMTLLSAAVAAPTKAFPPSVTAQGIQNIVTYVNNVVADISLTKFDQIGTDYSSTGRSLAFLSRDLLSKGCKARTTGKPTHNANDAILALHETQLILAELELDAIEKNLATAQKDVCRAVARYGDVASYVQTVAKYDQ